MGRSVSNKRSNPPRMILCQASKPFSSFSFDKWSADLIHTKFRSNPLLGHIENQIQFNLGNNFDHVVSILTTSWLTPQNACWPLTCSRDCFVFCLFTSTPPSSFFSPTTSADNPCLMPPLLPSCCCWWWLLSTADCWLLVLVSLVAALIQLATRTSSCRTRRTSSCIRAPTMLQSKFCNWNEVD